MKFKIMSPKSSGNLVYIINIYFYFMKCYDKNQFLFQLSIQIYLIVEFLHDTVHDKMSEVVMVAKLQPEHITEDFCTKHSISSHSAGHCKELLQQWSSRQGGHIL